MKEILSQAAKYEQNYKQVIIETATAQPHIFTLFYTHYPPEKYHQDIINMGGIPSPRKNFDFGKYAFKPVLWRNDKYFANTLFIAPESSLPDDVKNEEMTNLYEKIYDRYGNMIGVVAGTK